MKDKFTEVIISLYESLRYSVKDIAIFPGENLKGVLQFATLVSIFSTIAHFVPYKTFALLDWRGAWIGTLVLSVLYLISFKEGDGNSNGEVNDDGVSSTHEEDAEVSSAGSGDDG